MTDSAASGPTWSARLRRNAPLILAGTAFVFSGAALTAEGIDNQWQRECFSASTQVVVAEQATPKAERVINYRFRSSEVQELQAELTEAKAVLESYSSLRSCLDRSTAREVNQAFTLTIAALSVLQAGQAIPQSGPSASPG